jgi:drug/metabolite transporter (DMT)-like permease
MTSTLRAPLLIGALALLWGSGFFWIKLALDGLRPFQLTFARLALGALVLGAIVAVRQLPLPRTRSMWAHLTVAALISNAIPYTLFAVAEQTVASSLAGTINATTPLWTAVIAAGVGVERLASPRRVAGLVIGFGGAMVLLSPWDGDVRGTLFGALACVGAAVSYGVSYVYQARYVTNRGFPPLMLAFAQMSAATALLALTLPVAGRQAPELTTQVVVAITVLGVLGTGIAYVINYALITTEGPTAASVVTYLVPAVSVALGAALLSEPTGPSLISGAALILVGVALVQRRRTPAGTSARQATPPRL